MLKRSIMLILIAVLAGGLLVACAQAPAPGGEAAPAEDAEAAAPGEPKHGGILTYGLVGDPPSLDPHIQKGAADATVKNQVYNRLLTWDVDMNVVPDLAESWEIVDDTTILFTLRRRGEVPRRFRLDGR